jgi:hypothetical protein
MIGSDEFGGIESAGKQGVVGESIERSEQATGELGESEGGLRREEIERDASDFEAMMKVKGSFLGRERCETNPGGDALFEREKPRETETRLEVVVAGKNQDKVTDGIEVGSDEEPEFVEGLIGEEVSLIDDEQRSDARAAQLGALCLNPMDHAAADEGWLETQLVTDMHEEVEGGTRSMLNGKSFVEAGFQL